MGGAALIIRHFIADPMHWQPQTAGPSFHVQQSGIGRRRWRRRCKNPATINYRLWNDVPLELEHVCVCVCVQRAPAGPCHRPSRPPAPTTAAAEAPLCAKEKRQVESVTVCPTYTERKHVHANLFSYRPPLMDNGRCRFSLTQYELVKKR